MSNSSVLFLVTSKIGEHLLLTLNICVDSIRIMYIIKLVIPDYFTMSLGKLLLTTWTNAKMRKS